MSNSPRRGLTLLELLIAIGLSTFLLVALWQMLGSFASVYEKGQVNAERAQLARSIKQQLRSDLRHCYVPRSERRSNGNASSEGTQSSSSLLATSVDDFIAESALFEWPPSIDWSTASISFVGEPNAMLIDIFELPSGLGADGLESSDVDVIDAVTAPFDMAANPDPSQSTQKRGSAYRRVVYLFHDAAATGTETLSPSRGLLRRSWELGTEPIDPPIEDFDPLLWFPPIEYPEESALAELSTTSEATESQTGFATDSLLDETPGSASLLTWVNDTIETDHVPEVSKLRFRYYDGISWRSRWQSSKTGDVPIAVELVFDLHESDSPVVPERSEDNLEAATSSDSTDRIGSNGDSAEVVYETIDFTSDDYTSGGVESTEFSSDEFWIPQHRLIIFLRPDRSDSDSESDSDLESNSDTLSGDDRE